MEWVLVLHLNSDPLTRHMGIFFQFMLTVLCIIMLLTLESIQGVLFCEINTYLFIIGTWRSVRAAFQPYCKRRFVLCCGFYSFPAKAIGCLLNLCLPPKLTPGSFSFVISSDGVRLLFWGSEDTLLLLPCLETAGSHYFTSFLSVCSPLKPRKI